MEYITKNAEETFELGRKVGSSLVTRHQSLDTSIVVALTGDLGAGKTTFLQGFARGLGIKNKIVSPTFILMRKYDNFYHLDLYRLEENVKKEVKNLGLFDIWSDENNIVAIEWAEKLKIDWPKNTMFINFENISENERKISVQ